MHQHGKSSRYDFEAYKAMPSLCKATHEAKKRLRQLSACPNLLSATLLALLRPRKHLQHPPPTNPPSNPHHLLVPPPQLPTPMGLFTSSSPSPPPPTPASPTPSPDGAFEAPDRQSRAHCWRARDAFFACLELNGIVDSIREKERADGACGVEGKGFEKDCAASWVCFVSVHLGMV